MVWIHDGFSASMLVWRRVTIATNDIEASLMIYPTIHDQFNHLASIVFMRDPAKCFFCSWKVDIGRPKSWQRQRISGNWLGVMVACSFRALPRGISHRATSDGSNFPLATLQMFLWAVDGNSLIQLSVTLQLFFRFIGNGRWWEQNNEVEDLLFEKNSWHRRSLTAIVNGTMGYYIFTDQIWLI